MSEEIIISTNNKNLQLDAEMLRVKAEFMKLGFNTFPSDLIAEECPYTNPKDIASYIKEAGNVWRGRNRNEGIIEDFNNALNRVKKE